uniref:Rod shape-determining protein MreD n=1 Tax=Brugia timori TaxID=42155 RepID=A0A0R3RAB3_9BILA
LLYIFCYFLIIIDIITNWLITGTFYRFITVITWYICICIFRVFRFNWFAVYGVVFGRIF